MVLPVLLLLLMGIIEYNTIMYAMAVLDGAITAAAREGSTGYVNDTGTGSCPSPVVAGVVTPQTQAQFINCFVGLRVAGLLSPSSLAVSYNDTASSTFSSTTDAPTFSATPCTNSPALVTPSLPLCSESSQNAGDIVVYTVTYPWPVFTPILKPFFGNSSTFTLQASAVVKNEPYNVSSSR
jgi:Flp pilus assembly protein TadG